MDGIQELFRNAPGDMILLTSGEYEGPLVIDRPCTLDGQSSTLWAEQGPVLSIRAAGVTVKNLRVEVTGLSAQNASGTGQTGFPDGAKAPRTPDGKSPVEPSLSRTALFSASPDAKLINVEVSGEVSGIAGETAGWNLSALELLPDFAAGQNNSFSFEWTLPAPARLRCEMKGVRVEPEQLQAGKNIIRLEIAPMRDRMILYGEIFVETGVVRRVYVKGKAVSGAKKYTAPPLPKPVTPEHAPQKPVAPVPETPKPANPVTPKPEQQNPNVTVQPSAGRFPGESVSSSGGSDPLPSGNSSAMTVTPGQRISDPEMKSRPVKIVWESQTKGTPLEVDAYAFRLNEKSKVVSGDNDLIFFDNETSVTGDVSTGEMGDYPCITVNLSAVPAEVSRIAACFSIYKDDTRNFAAAQFNILRVYIGEKERYCMPFDRPGLTRTAVALEIYRYRGEWKLNFIGGGYSGGLERLCEQYGLEAGY